MIYFRQALRQIRARPGRALLTTLSIVIAVAAVVAVSFTTGRLGGHLMTSSNRSRVGQIWRYPPGWARPWMQVF